MANEQTYRIRFEADTQQLTSSLPGMVSRVGQSMQATAGYASQALSGMSSSVGHGYDAVDRSIGSLQYGGAFAMQSMAGAGGSLGNAYGAYSGMRSAAITSHSDGVYQGVQNAAMYTRDASNSGAAGALTGAGHFGASVAGGMGLIGIDMAVSAQIAAQGTKAAYAAGYAMELANAAKGITLKQGAASVAAAESAAMGGGGSTFGAMAGWGASAGRGIAGRLGFGALGTAAGGFIGGATAMLAPYMAVDAVVGSVVDDIAKTSEISRAINTYDVTNNRGLASTGTGRFSSSQRQDMSKFVMGMANSVDSSGFGQGKMGLQGLTQIMSGMQKEIFADSSLTPEKFREVFSKKVKQVKDFAMAFDKSIGEAVDAMKKIKGLGFSDAFDGASQLGMTGRFSGLGTQGMIGVANSSGQAFINSGLGRGQGAMAGMHSASDIGTMQRLGMMSKGDMARVGGIIGATNSTVGLQAAFMNSSVGQTMLAAAVRNGSVNGGAVDDIISGKIGTSGMLNLSSGLAGGGVNALSDFYANKEKYARQLTSSQQFGMIGASAMQMLGASGMSMNQSNLQTVLRSQFGMSGAMASMMAKRISDPSILRSQLDASSTNMMARVRASDAASAPSLFNPLWAKRASEAIGRGFGNMRDSFRRNISNPIGGIVNGISAGLSNTVDSFTGSSTYQTDPTMNSLDRIAGNISTGGQNISSLEYQRAAFNSMTPQIKALVDRARAGGTTPEWVKILDGASVSVGGGSTSYSHSRMSKSQFQTVMTGIRSREAAEGGIRAGMGLSQKNIQSRWGDEFSSKKTQAAVRALHDAAASGRLTSAQAARIAINSGGINGIKAGTGIDSLSRVQTQKIGGLLSYAGVTVDDRGIMSTGIDARSISLMQERGVHANREIKNLYRTSGFWGSGASAISNPMQTVFGAGFAETVSDMGAETRSDVAELLAIISNNDGSGKARAKALAAKLRKNISSLPQSKRVEVMKIISLADEVGDDGKWVTDYAGRNGQRIQTRVGAALASLKEAGYGKRALGLASDARGLKTAAAKKAVALEYAHRVGFDLDNAVKTGQVKSVEDRIKKGKGDVSGFKSLIGKFDTIGSGDIASNLMSIGEFGADVKNKGTLATMDAKGGALGRLASITRKLANVRNLQEEDLLSDISNKDPVLMKMVSGAKYADSLKTEEAASAQFGEVRKRLLSGHFKKDGPMLLKALSGFKTDRQRMRAVNMMALGKSKGERGALGTMILATETSPTSGSITTSAGPAGQYSAVAKQQIAALRSQTAAFASMLKVVESLHLKMTGRPVSKNTGRIQ